MLWDAAGEAVLMGLVESMLEVAELKAAATQFAKLLDADKECAELLGSAVQAGEAEKEAPKPVRRNSKKENEPTLEEKAKANTSTTTTTTSATDASILNASKPKPKSKSKPKKKA